MLEIWNLVPFGSSSNRVIALTTRPATSWVGTATGSGGYCVTMIINVRTVRHMPTVRLARI
jgi:hypothetical protein